jgi:hypothetical protein
MGLKAGTVSNTNEPEIAAQGLRKGLSLFMNGTPEARVSGRKKKAHGPALRDGKGPQQAEQAREAGDRNLAAFSLARSAGFAPPSAAR